MSFSTTGMDGSALNQGAAHDTGLYDPSLHDNQIVAMYENDAQAGAAKAKLIEAGVPGTAIQLVARGSDAGTLGGVNAEDANGGIWGAIRSMFVPDEDRTAYSHAIGRGHAMLIVTPNGGMDRTMVIHTLETSGPIDFDARLEEWRQAGYDSSTIHQDYAPGAVEGAGVATGYVAPKAPAPVVATAPMTKPAGESIEVMEERLRVGKREVAAGAVRIRSYVVERPVEEQVRLREEHVSVERRPVDRAATAADMGAFQERTIEARATSEEAVVGKETRVVEEIGLRKEASERVETVRDTVRKTEVDIVGDATVAPKVR